MANLRQHQLYCVQRVETQEYSNEWGLTSLFISPERGTDASHFFCSVGTASLIPDGGRPADASTSGGWPRCRYTYRWIDSLRLYLAGGRPRYRYTLHVAVELGRKPPLYLAVEDPLTLLPPVVGNAFAIPVGG